MTTRPAPHIWLTAIVVVGALGFNTAKYAKQGPEVSSVGNQVDWHELDVASLASSASDQVQNTIIGPNFQKMAIRILVKTGEFGPTATSG